MSVEVIIPTNLSLSTTGSLLIFLSAKPATEPNVSPESRTINEKTIEDAVKKIPQKQPEFSSPATATNSSQKTQEGSPSAR